MSPRREQYLANREQELAKNKIYRDLNKEELKRKASIRKSTNREIYLLRRKEYRKSKAFVGPPKPREKKDPELIRKNKLLKCSLWHARNKDSVAKRHKRWVSQNRFRIVARTRKRDAAKLKATVSWVDHEKILRIYRLAEIISVITGVKHEVDHIVPLQGDSVCGLHCEQNLQIMRYDLNRSKHNRLTA